VNATNVALSVSNLNIILDRPGTERFQLKNITFVLPPRKSLALIGESGSGKTMIALSLLGLLPAPARATSGMLVCKDQAVALSDSDAVSRLRGKEIAMVFQDPLNALNPLFRVGAQVSDVVRQHQCRPETTVKSHVMRLFEQVKFHDPGMLYDAYPHQLSGGMAQRVLLAMALSCQPRILIADEPTTALDVTTQQQILQLIAELQRKQGFALLLISHDIAMVHRMADDIMVLHDGEIAEAGSAAQVLGDPQHPYTRMLLKAHFQLTTLPAQSGQDG
jgi:peptide/nickel transport system ATP-binding protein